MAAEQSARLGPLVHPFPGRRGADRRRSRGTGLVRPKPRDRFRRARPEGGRRDRIRLRAEEAPFAAPRAWPVTTRRPTLRLTGPTPRFSTVSRLRLRRPYPRSIACLCGAQADENPAPAAINLSHFPRRPTT